MCAWRWSDDSLSGSRWLDRWAGRRLRPERGMIWAFWRFKLSDVFMFWTLAVLAFMSCNVFELWTVTMFDSTTFISRVLGICVYKWGNFFYIVVFSLIDLIVCDIFKVIFLRDVTCVTLEEKRVSLLHLVSGLSYPLRSKCVLYLHSRLVSFELYMYAYLFIYIFFFCKRCHSRCCGIGEGGVFEVC